tara:strand:+ start:316 stop:543 length:228 start_codon:yes stop_codon:yes gene_type:complete
VEVVEQQELTHKPTTQQVAMVEAEMECVLLAVVLLELLTKVAVEAVELYITQLEVTKQVTQVVQELLLLKNQHSL